MCVEPEFHTMFRDNAIEKLLLVALSLIDNCVLRFKFARRNSFASPGAVCPESPDKAITVLASPHAAQLVCKTRRPCILQYYQEKENLKMHYVNLSLSCKKRPL